MIALALMPFEDSFKAVYKSMEEACAACAVRHKGLPGPQHRMFEQLTCKRIDMQFGSFEIVKSLIDEIRNCTFCIADVTRSNKNVMWELGFAMALEKPVIIITQFREEIPFDLQGLRNIEYKREDLKQSLEPRLIAEVEALAEHMPQQAVFPLHVAYAQAIAAAKATGSPAYFLDANYTIRYMNEAAALLFNNSTSSLNAAYWQGRSLREFMNSLSEYIENITAVEKNLQIQIEQIRELESMNSSEAVSQHNVETIIFNSTHFGRLELQKIGLAVKSGHSGRIEGWVVAFNIINADDPIRFARFHQRHADMVKGSFPAASPHSPVFRIAQRTVRSPESLDAWIEAGCPNPVIRLADSYAEKQICFEFAAQIMRTPDYGLKSVEKLDDWYFDYAKSDYVMMIHPDLNELAGVFRINYYPYKEEFRNLHPHVKELIRQGTSYADIGYYFYDDLSHDHKRHLLAMLLGYAVFVCRQIGIDYFYAQINSTKKNIYEQFLCACVGAPFQHPKKAFENWWIPVLFKLSCLHPAGDPEWVQSLPVTPDPEFLSTAQAAYKEAGTSAGKKVAAMPMF